MASTRLAIERILCPTDFSDFSTRALGRAVKIGRWFGARVTALHVMPRLDTALPTDGGGTYVTVAADILRAQRESRKRELDESLEPFLGEGVPIESKVVDGEPWRAIRAEAEALPADLVVMGTHGRSGFEHLLLGSVAEKVLRSAPCPVLTVGRTESDALAGSLFRRILCAADLTRGSEHTLDVALALADENLARVTLLHVVEGVLGEGRELYRPVPEVPQLRHSLVEHATEQLRRAGKAAHSFCDVDERVETGRAWRQILRVAEEISADLIVLGAHAHGALGRLFLGSTTNQVVRHAPCPVLTVRETAAPPLARGEAAASTASVR
jgi:nucleotide-binding universal stress UspA family protein